MQVYLAGVAWGYGGRSVWGYIEWAARNVEYTQYIGDAATGESYIKVLLAWAGASFRFMNRFLHACLRIVIIFPGNWYKL